MTQDVRNERMRARRNRRKIALGNGTILLFASAFLILFALKHLSDQQWGAGLLMLAEGGALAAGCLWILKKYWR
ncbi:MAG: hypothetical protein U0939_16920 [Pirellulales bacterium]